jgi:FixJ family two-component response regulator
VTHCPPSPSGIASAEQPIVFVVDDDQAVREAIRSLLASVGLRVETFKTAQEFLNRKSLDLLDASSSMSACPV